MQLLKYHKISTLFLSILCIFLIFFVDFSLQYTLRLSSPQDPSAPLPPRMRRNMLMFSKFHRSMWPYEQEAPKRFVAMDSDPIFEY